MNKVALLSAHKNEGPFVLEFVAHHIAVGISNIFIVTNPSDDGTTELAQSLSDAGVIGHLHISTPSGQKPQDYAYAAARTHFDLDRYEWLLLLDADELLNIHCGDGSVGDFLGTFDQSIDVISINTACFGSFPHTKWSASPSSSSFCYRLLSKSSRNGVAKSIIHYPRHFRKLRPHGPVEFSLSRSINIAFHGGAMALPADPFDTTFYNSIRTPGTFDGAHRIAQINHYAVRTWDAFQVRAARGRGAAAEGRSNSRHTIDYFNSFGLANFHDTSIAKYSAKVNDVTRALLGNVKVRFCHDFALERFKGKLELFQ